MWGALEGASILNLMMLEETLGSCLIGLYLMNVGRFGKRLDLIQI